jgi:hypothetical protein
MLVPERWTVFKTVARAGFGFPFKRLSSVSQGIDDAAQSAGEASFSVAISVATRRQTLAFPGTA